MSSRFGQATGELRTLSHLIEVLADHGDRQAVLALQREDAESWSYGELGEYARRLARGLTEADVGQGDHVMLFAPSRPEWMVACLAIVDAGAVVTPVDVQLGEEALSRILGHSGARFIFTTTDQTEKLERLDVGSYQGLSYSTQVKRILAAGDICWQKSIGTQTYGARSPTNRRRCSTPQAPPAPPKACL